MDINQRLIKLKRVILSNAQKEIGHERKERITKPWITEYMINKMDERRKWKNKNNKKETKRAFTA